MKARNSLFILLCLAFFSGYSQNSAQSASVETRLSNESISLDGRLEERIWAEIEAATGFYQNFPSDDQPAIDDTEVRITYDDKFIYVGVKCYDGLQGDFIATTLRRDFSWIVNDNISIYFDPYNDLSNGFTFQVTPNNVQREGLVLLDGDVQDDWDNKWYSEVLIGDGYWSAEMAIPFKSIRYNSIKEWNMQVIRNNLKRNERTSWIAVKQGFRMSNLAFTGKLVWDNPPQKSNSNVVAIPYVASSVGKDIEEQEPTERELDAGFDAKVALSSSLNLDLTFNPDFSQVEVDRQVTNLQRFEINFPERRQFFLENQDLFAQGGFSRSSNPFFSRRIGIRGGGATVPIIAGARLSGKIGKKWRVGALNMVTNEAQDEEELVPAQNYSVAVLERQVFARSRISAMFVGRNNLGVDFVQYDSARTAETGLLQDENGRLLNSNDTASTFSRYNYVFGLDYNLATSDNRWEGNFFYHRSLDPGKEADKYATGGFLGYTVPEFLWRAVFERIGDNHNAEVGFIPRTGITRYGSRVGWTFFTDGILQSHGPGLRGGGIMDNNLNRLDNDANVEYNFNFLNTAEASISAGWNFVTLTDSFDPSGSDGLELAEGSELSWYRYRVTYRSDRRKNFIYRVDFSNGEFFNGNRMNIAAGLTFRFPPIIQVELNGEFNRVTLPEPYNDSDLYLIGPRVDLTLTNQLFLTTFVQYNTQENNLGHNSRLQWRFKPVSDLFIVYTDNYVTTDFAARNRALVVKLSYWLNL